MTAAGGAASHAPGQIMIGRHKHLPFIASYHGPWLSLPIDLLHSLLLLNAETAAPARAEGPSSTLHSHSPTGETAAAETAVVHKRRPPEAAVTTQVAKTPAQSAAPPLDPVIFKSLVAIRKLVDDASELVIKAAGGGASSNPLGISSGGGTLGSGGGSSHGSGSRVSGLRQHRFRELAVQKLARAYRIDEVATSVLTMQGASALDDVASKVLKRSPQNLDALYVHFFHEKIPSRMLAASTTTEALDKIISQRPGVAEYHRTRAMIHGFREEFPASLKDFKTAIMIAKKRRRLGPSPDCEKLPGDGLKKHHHLGDGSVSGKWEDLDECSEAQLYFLRGACYHQYAISLLDRAIQSVNIKAAAAKAKERTTQQSPAVEGVADRSGEKGKGGKTPQAFVSPDVLQAPLESYRPAVEPVVAQVASLARKSIRDYEKFLEFFPNPTLFEGGPIQQGHKSVVPQGDADEAEDVADSEASSPLSTIAEMEEFLRTVNLNSVLYGSSAKDASGAKDANLSSASSLATLRNALKDADLHSAAKNLLSLGTYHPLLVEAWYAIGINLMLLTDWTSALSWHSRIIKLQDSVDGYPVFLPARSMSQADYVEVITRMKRTLPAGKLLTDGKASNAPVKRITAGVKSLDMDDHGEAQETPSSALVVASKHADAGVVAKNGTGANGLGSSTERSSLRQYPLHTKRGEPISRVDVRSGLNAS
ncbi:hypothetical protein DFJ74DRAFT_685311 [Hyaloraphidium curvatum]|nr:hypothetical protein DFJ74DRAFT_685311 [Hyaloraphidium curvatum]